MKKRSDKEQEAKALNLELARVSTVILSTFQGIKVAEDSQLRRAVEAAGGEYKVVKNTVVERAAAGTPAEQVLKGLQGTNSIAYTAGDPVALAKTLTEYARNNPTFTFKAGMVEGRVIEIKSIQELASMPSREELLARLYGIEGGADSRCLDMLVLRLRAKLRDEAAPVVQTVRGVGYQLAAEAVPVAVAAP